MKKLILLFLTVFTFAEETLQFTIPKEIITENENNNSIKSNLYTNKTDTLNNEKNISSDEINNSIENNSSVKTVENNSSETNKSVIFKPEITEENFNINFATQNTKVSFAVIIDKAKFFKFLPSMLNSINAYLIQKGVDFNITVYNNDVNISSLPQKYIIDIETDKSKITNFKNYNKIFFIPTFNKDDFNETFKNIYFGGINFKQQLNQFDGFINNRLITVSQKSQISQKLLEYEKENPFFIKNYNVSNIDYDKLDNSFVILNTDTSKSAQILSKITSKNIKPLLIFSPQLCYSTSIIFLTQPQDTKKLLIANSILNPPSNIEDYANLLNSDIKYNWLNYATDVLVNKIYNLQNSEDMFYMNDFHIYIFNNQINYHTKLYQIKKGAFKEVR